MVINFLGMQDSDVSFLFWTTWMAHFWLADEVHLWHCSGVITLNLGVTFTLQIGTVNRQKLLQVADKAIVPAYKL
jgi:hypothetical protein